MTDEALVVALWIQAERAKGWIGKFTIHMTRDALKFELNEFRDLPSTAEITDILREKV